MENKVVRHTKYGTGVVTEIIDRTSFTTITETGEVIFNESSLPNLIKVSFESGENKTFQVTALENSNWFIQEMEV